jgi:hypothetical protein
MTNRRVEWCVLALLAAGCGGTSPDAGRTKQVDAKEPAAPIAEKPAAPVAEKPAAPVAEKPAVPTVRSGSMEEVQASIDAMCVGLSAEQRQQFAKDMYDLGQEEGRRQFQLNKTVDPLELFRKLEGKTVAEIHELAEASRRQEGEKAPAVAKADPAPAAPASDVQAEPDRGAQVEPDRGAGDAGPGALASNATKPPGSSPGLPTPGAGESEGSPKSAGASESAKPADTADPPAAETPKPASPPPPRRLAGRLRPRAAAPAGAGGASPGIAQNAGPDPSQPAEIPIQPSYVAERLVQEPEGQFDDRRERVRDVAPDGGLLVGVRVGYRDIFGGNRIAAIQPIFQVGDAYVEGQISGGPVPLVTTIVARPGYAVGALQTKTGGGLNAFRLEFMRVDETRLDMSDAYHSAWIGEREGGGPTDADGAGRFVVGIVVRSDSGGVTGLGLVLDSGPDPSPAMKSRRDESPRPPVPATDAGPDPAKPAEIALGVEYEPGSLVDDPDSQRNGGNATFRETAPDRGLLVGAFVRHAVTPDEMSIINAVQPIYQVGNEYRLGEFRGEPTVPEVTVVARPGYAVGAVETKRGERSICLRPVFMRVGKDGLDPDDSYRSSWIGLPREGQPTEVRGEGHFAVGIVGQSAGGVIHLIDLVFAPDAATARLPEAGAKPVDRPPAADPGPDPSKPAEFEIALEYSRNHVETRPLREFGGLREGFSTIGPRGGILVGFRATIDDTDGHQAINSLTPIYQVGGTYQVGRRMGRNPDTVTRILARPGYAVAGIDARVAGPLTSVRFEFMRADGDRLDPDDSYVSDWVGHGRGHLSSVTGDGYPVVGILGRGNSRGIEALGLVIAK